MSDNSLQKLYADIDYCKQELMQARKLFGLKTTTEKQYDAMEASLGYMLLFAPEKLVTIIHATLLESTSRKYYFMLLWASAERYVA